jgi:DNA-binding transcriptional LysR family regulator
MNSIDRMRVFIRVAELGSFTQAADDFGMQKGSVSTAVQQLEAELGTRLLHRTTRKVQPTQDGLAFLERSKDLLADMDELQTLFRQDGKALQGRVRIDMSTGLARNAVVPRLPELLARHPLLEFEISSTERFVDPVREGFDCVLRTGTVADSALVARPVGEMRMVNCASPAYVAAHGLPTTPADLHAHRVVHFVNTLGARPGGFDFIGADGRDASMPMAGAVTVNNADAYSAACLAGLGIIQVPFIGVGELLADGRLVEVLPDWPARPMPLNLIYANRRNLSRRVRIVMDWLTAVIGEFLTAHAHATERATSRQNTDI